MFSQETCTQNVCDVCGSTDFNTESGFYFCSRCHTQKDDMREEVYQERFVGNTRITKTAIKRNKDKINIDLGWTSWELNNFVMIGAVDRLIALGIDPAIKNTILQLWATYLQKLEVAFTSTTTRIIPKLSLKYYKKDAQIIYGKIQAMKKKRRRKKSNAASSFTSGNSSNQSLSRQKRIFATSEYEKYINTQSSTEAGSASSVSYSDSSRISSNESTMTRLPTMKFNKEGRRESRRIRSLSKKVSRGKRGDFEKLYIRNCYRIKPHVITLSKLWALIYLALKVQNENMNISDLLRFFREGYLPFYKIDNFIPEWVKLTKSDKQLFTVRTNLRHRGFRTLAAAMAKFLEVYNFAKPDLGDLIEQYCTELQLPRGITLYAKRLLILTQPKMKYRYGMFSLPNYEARAMCFIIVALKLLFSFDGVTEYKISKLAEDVNREASVKNVLDSTLFSFREWQWYIECRRHWISLLHLPTATKFGLDDECYQLFVPFYESFQSNRGHENDEKRTVNNVKNAFDMWFEKLNSNLFSRPDIENFEPSLTPMHSYLQQLLQNPNYDLPDILRVNFVETKIGYLTKPKKLIDLAAQCDIKVKVINTNLNYIEKMVPSFSCEKISPEQRANELKGLVLVENYKNDFKQNTENVLEFLQEREIMTVKINNEKHNLYNCSKIKSEKNEFELNDDDDDDDFCFNDIDSNGKLSIPTDSDSDTESDAIFDIPEENLFNCEKKNLSSKKFPSVLLRRKLMERIYKRNIKTGKIEWLKLAENVDIDKLNKEANSDEEYVFVKESLSTDNEESDDSNDENAECLKDIRIDSTVDDTDNCRLLFRPFKDYWMYHCDTISMNDSNKYIKRFEKELSNSFNWLLNECSNILETSKADLYNEYCFVENYIAFTFDPHKKLSKTHKRLQRNTYAKFKDFW